MEHIRIYMIKKLYNSFIAVTCGAAMWYVIATHLTFNYVLEIPLVVHNTNPETYIEHPTHTKITVILSPSDLLLIDNSSMGVHINGNTLIDGTHTIAIKPEFVILPHGIKIVHCNPIHFTVHKNTSL